MKSRLMLILMTAFAPCFFTVHGELSDGLVAYYPFTGNANDESGGGHHLNVNEAVLAADRFTRANQAYYFDGTNDFMVVSNRLVSANPFTWSVWVKYLGNTNFNNNYILHQGSSYNGTLNGQYSPVLGLDDDSKPPRLRFSSYSGEDNFFESPWLVTNFSNNWHQIVITSASDGNRGMFIDGVQVSAATNHVFGQLNPNFFVGANQTLIRGYFHGYIDDIRVYNRELSADEVAQLYMVELGGAVSLRKAVYLESDNLLVGSTYKIQQSLDMTNWVDSGPTFQATNYLWRSTNYWDVGEWEQYFWRLQKQ